MLVKPDRLGLLPLGEKEQIRLDAGVRVENTLRQANDRVEVAFSQQVVVRKARNSIN